MINLLILTVLLTYSSMFFVFLLQEKEGPFNCLERVRDLIVIPEELLYDEKKLEELSSSRRSISEWYSCPICLGTWILAVAWLLLYATSSFEVLHVVFAYGSSMALYSASYTTFLRKVFE